MQEGSQSKNITSIARKSSSVSVVAVVHHVVLVVHSEVRRWAPWPLLLLLTASLRYHRHGCAACPRRARLRVRCGL